MQGLQDRRPDFPPPSFPPLYPLVVGRWNALFRVKPAGPSTKSAKNKHDTIRIHATSNPAYAQASLYYEWKPAIFAQVRLQYDLYRFFGDHGVLLSFPSADAKFGKHEIDTQSGQEETGWGHRVMLQPIITAKTGPVIFRNTTDLAYYRFDGRGPYFLESEYDTLLKNNDFLLNNRTAILLEAWKGSRAQTLLVGPFYEITYGSRAEITRQRAGMQTFWSPADSIGFFKRPRVYAQIGMNLQDRNRDNEAFFTAGTGFDF